MISKWIYFNLILHSGHLSFSQGDDSPQRFLKKYDKLSYSLDHTRIKRSNENNKIVRIPIVVVKSKFIVSLKPDDDHVFDKDVKILTNGLPSEESISQLPLYKGYVEGDDLSSVKGTLFDNIFDGVIRLSNGEVFYVERVKKYYHRSRVPLDHHSIIYRESDIDHDELVRPKRSVKPSPHCGMSDETVKAKVDHIQHLPESTPSYDELLSSWQQLVAPNLANGALFNLTEHEDETPFHRYSRSLNEAYKRIERSSDKIPKKNKDGVYDVRTCTLSIQTDQVLFKNIFRQEGNRDNKKTRQEILALVNSHVSAVNEIYRQTSFNGIVGINFRVVRVTVFDESSCVGGQPASHTSSGQQNPFCDDMVDVSNYLNLNSMQNHSSFCLHYAITYRDFTEGTLGLAWVASAQSSTHGGICELYKQYAESSKRINRSLNTGIVTLVNYNNRVPPRVSQLTLAHEIGHNFGANHDPGDRGTKCRPTTGGNFIMFASATAGDKPNNPKFSPCSVETISVVLKAVLKQLPVSDSSGYSSSLLTQGHHKRNCFVGDAQPFCGNGLVEKGEECDCGWTEQDCKGVDPQMCCGAATLRSGAENPNRCKRRFNGDIQVKCSPTEGPCCTNRCSFMKKDPDTPCRKEQECSVSAACPGDNATCPESGPKLNNTICANNTKLCRNGACSASICERVGAKQCFLNTKDKVDQCLVACNATDGVNKGVCRSSGTIEELKEFYSKDDNNKIIDGIQLQAGSPCDNYLGYCDIFKKCRSVDSDGPLARLKKWLFSKESLEKVGKWVEDHWWAVVLMGIGLILVMALFIKFCAVHTPSSNPNRAPAHSIYETIRRPATLLRSAANGEARHRSRNNRSRSRPNEAGRGAERGGRSGGGGREHRHRHHNHGDVAGNNNNHHRNNRTSAAENGAQLIQMPQGVIIAEPPPPYSAVVASAASSNNLDPGVAIVNDSSNVAVVVAAAPTARVPGGGPKPGHRKNREPKHKQKQVV